MNLKTNSSVNPIILKGRRINQISGRKNIRTNARGQHITNKIHQRIIARIVFMKVFVSSTKHLPINKSTILLRL